MPRYLTPAKIALLALIDVYLSPAFPSKCNIHVLTFLAPHIVQPTFSNDTQLDVPSLDIVNLPNQLSRWKCGDGPSTVWDLLSVRLWQLNDLNALFVFFLHLKELFERVPCRPDVEDNSEDDDHEDEDKTLPPRLSQASPLGQFVRKCRYEFERLQFSDAQKLWSTFFAYRATSASSPPGDQPQTISPEYTSTQDIDVLLNASVQLLQNLGTRVPESVRSKLKQWFEAQHDMNAHPSRHFMAFFEHWRAGQMSMALESLHQYFDYSVGANRGNENLKVYFQYAQLHQSILYADFECWEESVNAMNECIATARENQDTACLNFALSWLLHLRQVHPSDNTTSYENLIKLLGGSSEHDEIAYLKTKAREGKHWTLMCTTLLEEAKLEMFARGNTSKVFEHIIQSRFMMVQHDRRSLLPAAALYECGGLDRLGQSRLAYRTCEGTRLLYRPYASTNDKVNATCRMAQTLAQTGQHQAAQQLLASAEEDVKGVLKLQDRLSVWKVVLQFKRLIHSDRLREAREFLPIIRFVKFMPEIEIDLKTLEIEFLIKAKDFERALTVVNDAIEQCKRRRTPDIAQRLRLLVSKSRIFAAGGQPVKGFSLAMRAALTAERSWLVFVLAEALSALSTILISLGEFHAGRELIEATLPHALGRSDVQLEAELFSSLADSHAGLAGGLSHKSDEQLRQLNFAEVAIGRSQTAFQRIGDFSGLRDCLLKKATLQRVKGETSSAGVTYEMYARSWDEHNSRSLNEISTGQEGELGV